MDTVREGHQVDQAATQQAAQEVGHEATEEVGHEAAQGAAQAVGHEAAEGGDQGKGTRRQRNERREAGQHPPMGLEGYAACVLWLIQARSHHTNLTTQPPDHKLLTMGLPQGRIRRARVTQDTQHGSAIVMVTFWDQRADRETTERMFDPAGFLCLRLLLLPKALIRVDHTDLPPKTPLNYLTVYDDITVLRVLAAAQPGEVIEQRKGPDGQVLNHYDVRSRNLVRRAQADVRAEGKAVRQSHQGRSDAITLALNNLDKGKERIHYPLSLTFFEWLLNEGFSLLDDMHGHEIG
jgi:hypothetical protein